MKLLYTPGAFLGSQWGCLRRQLISTAVPLFVTSVGVWPDPRLLRHSPLDHAQVLLWALLVASLRSHSQWAPQASGIISSAGPSSGHCLSAALRRLGRPSLRGLRGQLWLASFLPLPVLSLGPRAFQPARVSWPPRPARALVSVRSNLKKESVRRRKRFECPLPGIVNCYFSIVRLVAADQRTRISGTSCSPCSIPKASCVPISPSLISIAPRLDVAWSWLARPGLVMCGLVWCDRRLYHDMFGPGMVWQFLPTILWCWVLVLKRQRPAFPLPLVLLPLLPSLPLPPACSLFRHTPHTFRGPIGSST